MISYLILNLSSSRLQVSAAGQFDSVIVGSWRGIKVAYKPLNIKRITMNRKMLVEFRQVERLSFKSRLIDCFGYCLC